MTTTDPLPDILVDRADDPVGEALLLQEVRDGSLAAFGILYARYRPFAVGVAQRVLPPADAAVAEDVVEVSFIRVLTALRNGKGPTDTLRAYLATAVRREAWRAQRRRRRQAEVVDRWSAGEERATADVDRLAVRGDELSSHALLGEAFRGLSERWRSVLWLTVVEGRKPAEVAPMLGVSPGTASALAYRARNGLIAAYVAAYLRTTDDEDCAAISQDLKAYIAAGAPAVGFAPVVAHLEGCRSCREVVRGVDVLGSVLASMAPFGLLTAGWWAQAAGPGTSGLAAASAGARAAGGTGTGGTIGAGTVAVAVAAAVAVAGAAWFGLTGGSPDRSAAGATSTVASHAVPTSTAVVPPEPAPRPTAVASTTSTSAPAPSPGAPPRRPRPRPAAGAAPVVPVTTAAPPAASTSTSSSTSTTSSTASTSTSTSTTVPAEPVGGPLSGRVVEVRPDPSGSPSPVAGVDVVAYDEAGRLSGATTTDASGRWVLAQLATGRYLVVAVAPPGTGRRRAPIPGSAGRPGGRSSARWPSIATRSIWSTCSSRSGEGRLSARRRQILLPGGLPLR